MNLSLLNSLCYTVGWFWCVLCGVNSQPLLAIIGTLFLITVQLYCTKIKNLSLYIQDLLLVIFSVPLGIFLEMLFINTNLIQYANTNNRLPPLWIIGLYPLFSLLCNHSLKILQKNYLASFLLGFLGAPLSYMAGMSLKGLTFGYPLFQTWVYYWNLLGAFLCLLIKIAKIIEKATAETFSDLDSKGNLKLLYDGKCPICKREICLLQKHDKLTKVQFIDISSKDFLSTQNNDIDYKIAMSQIHAINAKGEILIGIPAFAAVYARCHLMVVSTLLRIPFIIGILKPLYKLFAKKRLWMTGRSDINLKK